MRSVDRQSSQANSYSIISYFDPFRADFVCASQPDILKHWINGLERGYQGWCPLDMRRYQSRRAIIFEGTNSAGHFNRVTYKLGSSESFRRASNHCGFNDRRYASTIGSKFRPSSYQFIVDELELSKELRNSTTYFQAMATSINILRWR